MSSNNADAEIAQPETPEINEIPAAEDSMSNDEVSSATDNGITQAQVYDNLKRIGELEDQKKKIQEEIQDRTEQLREVIVHIDRGSILYKMLDSALRDFNPKDVAASMGKSETKGAPIMSPKRSRRKTRRK
jgi:hypothetical protein